MAGKGECFRQNAVRASAGAGRSGGGGRGRNGGGGRAPRGCLVARSPLLSAHRAHACAAARVAAIGITRVTGAGGAEAVAWPLLRARRGRLHVSARLSLHRRRHAAARAAG
eukprot:3704454-Prymnesium_polylepis.1